MFLPVEALSVLEVGGVQAEVQHGADLGRWKGCSLRKVIVQKKALINSLYGFGGRDACEERDDIDVHLKLGTAFGKWKILAFFFS